MPSSPAPFTTPEETREVLASEEVTGTAPIRDRYRSVFPMAEAPTVFTESSMGVDTR